MHVLSMDKTHTQRQDTVNVTPSFFHGFISGQKQETHPTSDPSTLNPPNHESHDQIEDHESVTDLRSSDSPYEASESNTDNEPTYQP